MRFVFFRIKTKTKRESASQNRAEMVYKIIFVKQKLIHMRILILNGPNLNLTGTRETEIYGHQTFDSFIEQLFKLFPKAEITYKQSNIEGELINILQATDHEFDGIVFNPAAYSHTSIALADTIRSLKIPVIEVHLSNIFARENYRKKSFTAEVSKASLSGFGMDGYRMAVDYLLRKSL